jgi:hypothetical protein
MAVLRAIEDKIEERLKAAKATKVWKRADQAADSRRRRGIYSRKR